jgi:hypothetical protein
MKQSYSCYHYGLTADEWRLISRRAGSGLLTLAAVVVTIYAMAVWL